MMTLNVNYSPCYHFCILQLSTTPLMIQIGNDSNPPISTTWPNDNLTGHLHCNDYDISHLLIPVLPIHQVIHY